LEIIWIKAGKMSKQSPRRWTAQQKLAILEEARKEGVQVSDVCRNHQIAPAVFYDWERKMRQGALQSLTARQTQPARRAGAPSRTLGEAEAEITRLKEVIAEIAEENLRIKKGLWP
jgi:transposase-like protein